MLILHIDDGQRMQGGQWQVLYLLRGLRNRGHSQVLLARGELARRAREEGFDVRVAGCYPPADLVHAHDAHSHTFAAIRPQRPLVVSRRVGFPVGEGWLSRWKYRRPTHFIAISQYVAGRLAASGVPASKISVVYDGVPIPEEREWQPGGPVFGVLKDPLSPLLMESARAAGLEVRGVGAIENDMRIAGTFAYVTAMQGLGSAALFALAAGVPVVASNVGGLSEVVKHEQTGLLVENSSAAISAALLRIHRDPAFASWMSRQSREEARERFSVDRMVEGTIAIYERLLG